MGRIGYVDAYHNFSWPILCDRSLICKVKLSSSVTGHMPCYSSCTALWLTFLDDQAKLLCDRNPNMEIQAVLFCDWLSIWILKLHYSVVGLLSGYSIGTPLWLASYLDIQAVLLCDWPSNIIIQAVLLCDRPPNMDIQSVLWLASYLDIQALLLCDWPPT